MKTKLAAFWALAVTSAFSNPTKPDSQPAPEPPTATTPPCSASLALVASVPSEPEEIENLVTETVTKFPNCSCEIVKAVIEKTKAEPKLVGRIVHAAIVAAPEHMRLTAQCAIAVAPDALAEVQSVFAALEANAGETGSSAKSAKSAKSPKDAKGGGVDTPEAPNGYLMSPAYLPVGIPGGRPPTNPGGPEEIPEVTPVDPCCCCCCCSDHK
jgi:hypothetical protein